MLQTLDVTTMPLSECKEAFGGRIGVFGENIIDSQYCGSYSDGGSNKHSGAAIQLLSNGTNVSKIVGIASFRQFAYNLPAVYTRVASYIDWIEKTVWLEEKTTLGQVIRDIFDDGEFTSLP